MDLIYIRFHIVKPKFTSEFVEDESLSNGLNLMKFVKIRPTSSTDEKKDKVGPTSTVTSYHFHITRPGLLQRQVRQI